jgi:hypothetical protein
MILAKEEIGVASLATKYISGLAGLNALIVHEAPPSLGSPESRLPNLMNGVNILPWYTLFLYPNLLCLKLFRMPAKVSPYRLVDSFAVDRRIPE